eukprot:TRINITY_DN69004_c0_g1_i1.p3 TRINITY_DN69004_c0_g1~~TRINITY_DN69004_c0_g1_i1.p3  ORF type:complete len:107 (-),score=24.24 TRINITY_DN69004_c0_g1_i1:49-369(-)
MCIRDSINAEYMGPELSFAVFRIKEGNTQLCFAPEGKNYIIAVSTTGKYYVGSFDAIKGGECKVISDIDLVLSLIHISEPTRPLYISYAVFCLKKKKNTYTHTIQI